MSTYHLELSPLYVFLNDFKVCNRKYIYTLVKAVHHKVSRHKKRNAPVAFTRQHKITESN